MDEETGVTSIRLIYAGHAPGLEQGLSEDMFDGGSRAEQLAFQVLVLMGSRR